MHYIIKLSENTNKIVSIILLCFIILSAANAQEPVTFTVQQNKVSADEMEVVFKGKIDAGWHVYSTNLAKGGPTSATLNVEQCEGAEKVGTLQTKGKEISIHDNLFGMNVRYFENAVTFIQRFKITAEKYNIKGYLEYGACSDAMCLPPTSVEFAYSGKGKDQHEDKEADKNSENGNETDLSEKTDSMTILAATDSLAKDSPLSINNDLWTPVISELNAFGGDTTASKSLWWIFLMGLLGGLIALFTPCVWPIIPMTVSFFLKRAKDRSKAIKDAVIYGVSIVVIYLTLGLLITAIFGASKLNDLATNAVFNIFFFLLLVVFALSFFGWFELRLPSRWSNSVDSKVSGTSGLLSIFLMAFTLSLVSFSCTGPIIGFLLVDFATSGSITAPAIGMLGFALALALPFALFALFPTWIKKAPKSGSWMNTIKVTLGFIELAFSLKFLSVADLAYGWGILDREVFLALWIAIFGLLGLYLIGKLKFQSDMMTGESKPMPVVCIMLGLCSFAFAIYMIPGLWGAPCKAISAFAPPMSTQDF